MLVKNQTSKCVVLEEVDPTIPRTTHKLILTSNPAVFDYYQRNIELHPDKDKVQKRYEQFLEQDHKSQPTKDIFRNINRVNWVYKMKFFNKVYAVGPGIYPSNQFRSSKELHKIARSIDNKRVLDYGCSNGFVGLATNQSEWMTFVDINPIAAEYLQKSVMLNGVEANTSIHVGNLPELDKQYDVIFFNPPFHLEDTVTEFNACLQDDSSVRIIEKFWNYITDYTHDDSVIYCSFSNKDPRALELLESSIAASGLTAELIVHKYKKTKSDVRIYKVTKG
jgi:methylase of polypeptide subunit release factors